MHLTQRQTGKPKRKVVVVSPDGFLLGSVVRHRRLPLEKQSSRKRGQVGETRVVSIQGSPPPPPRPEDILQVFSRDCKKAGGVDTAMEWIGIMFRKKNDLDFAVAIAAVGNRRVAWLGMRKRKAVSGAWRWRRVTAVVARGRK